MMSGRFTPAASTRMTIWPGPGTGSSTSPSLSASGGPLPPSTTMAFMPCILRPPRLPIRLARGQINVPAAVGKGAPSMAEEEAELPRRARGAALVEVTREDLELFAVSDLEERIATLEAEIARVRA